MQKYERAGFAPIIIMITLLIGCASTSDTMESWIGAQESELVAKWGQPDEVVPNDPDGRIYVYIKENYRSSRPSDDLYRYGSGTRTSDIPGDNKALRLQYWFWLDNDGTVYKCDIRKEEILLE